MKADGCDIVSGLEESLRNEWNGDVDLGTGELQMMYQKYLDRLKRISSMVTSDVQDALCVLLQEKIDLAEDLQFALQGKSVQLTLTISSQGLPCCTNTCKCNSLLNVGLQTANDEYLKKIDGAQQKTLGDLAWKVDDLTRLSQNGRALLVDVTTKIELLEDRTTDCASANIPRQLTRLREKLIMFVKGRLMHVNGQHPVNELCYV